MILPPKTRLRLQFLARVVRKERKHLEDTDRRLFQAPFTAEQAARLDDHPELAERVEAFGSRFGRLQDTLGDKMLPVLLSALGEKPASNMDNLDRAERLGLIDSAEDWIGIRNLRNQMVHEYIEDPSLLADALMTGHASVPTLIDVAGRMLAEIDRRGLDRFENA